MIDDIYAYLYCAWITPLLMIGAVPILVGLFCLLKSLVEWIDAYIPSSWKV